jgi:hypothetical protein
MGISLIGIISNINIRFNSYDKKFILLLLLFSSSIKLEPVEVDMRIIFSGYISSKTRPFSRVRASPGLIVVSFSFTVEKQLSIVSLI